MNNFIFENKTRVYFGKGGVKEYLGCLLKHYGETVMLAYGGGSIKRNGVYDEVMGILNAAGKRVVEFSGIMSNPTYAKAQEGAKLARENHVDLILAVGGGSVSDCCKVISAQARLDEDIWEMQFHDGKCEVVYISAPNKTYSFQSGNVEILPLQKKIDPEQVIVTANGQTISEIDELLDFGGYYRIKVTTAPRKMSLWRTRYDSTLGT